MKLLDVAGMVITEWLTDQCTWQCQISDSSGLSWEKSLTELSIIFFSFLKNNNKESNEIIPDFQNQRKSFNTAYMYIAQCGLDQGATKITDEWNYEDLYFVLKAP